MWMIFRFASRSCASSSHSETPPFPSLSLPFPPFPSLSLPFPPLPLLFPPTKSHSCRIRYECARVPFAPAAVQLLQYAAACAGVPASPSSASAAAMMTELPRRSMQSLKASAALIASVANVAYTPQGKEALAQEQWAGKEGGAVALIAPLLLFDPPGVALRGQSPVRQLALALASMFHFAGSACDHVKSPHALDHHNSRCRGCKSCTCQHVRPRQAEPAHERRRVPVPLRG
jgi:hypothetical protein